MTSFECKSDKRFNLVNNIILGIFLLVVLYPLIYIISASFSSGEAVMTGRVWLWPINPTIEGYVAVFKHNLIMSGYANAFFYAFVGTIINVVFTILAAYPLSRKDFPGRNIFMFMFVFTMMFNAGLIPNYLIIKSYGMIDTRWVMLIPQALAVWNVIITRTFFQTTIPTELLEASELDGCSDINFILKIVLPLSKPIIAVITLFYAVGHWNRFFDAFIYLKSPELFPLQLVLRDILVMNQMASEMMNVDVETLEYQQNLAELLKYSLIVIASLPVMAIYPFVQKYFVKGVMVGSLKG